MKTKQQVEQIIKEIQDEIDFAKTQCGAATNLSDLQKWSDKTQQLMAQYNILLEVLR